MSKHGKHAEAIAEIMTIVLAAMAVKSSDVPDALHVFDLIMQEAREQLKKEWDTLRSPEFVGNFNAALAKLVETAKEIQSAGRSK